MNTVSVVLPTLNEVENIIPLIEGIKYLMMTDEEFIETYQIGQKQWF